jgi:hypothetical protein
MLADAHELFSQAVRPAEATADHRLVARAALGFGGIWLEEQRDELARRRLLRLCGDALAALPPEEAFLGARLEVRMAAERTYDGTGPVGTSRWRSSRVRSWAMRKQPPRRSLLYHHTLMLLPDRVTARLQVADELLDVATGAEVTIYALLGLCWRTHAGVQGDPPGASSTEPSRPPDRSGTRIQDPDRLRMPLPQRPRTADPLDGAEPPAG